MYATLSVIVWLAFPASGVHPTLAGVAIALLVPVYRPDRRDVENVRHPAAVRLANAGQGDYLFRSGDRTYDLILVEEGVVEFVRDSLFWVEEAVIARMGSPPAMCDAGR